MFVILSPVQIKPEYREAYIKAVIDATGGAVNEERGWLRCDIIQDAADPNRIWYYEVFTDEAAQQARLQEPEVKEFIEITKDWCDEGPLGAGLGSYNILPTDEGWK